MLSYKNTFARKKLENKYDACIHHYWHVWNSLENLFRKAGENWKSEKKQKQSPPTPLSKVNQNTAEGDGASKRIYTT